MSGRHVPWTSWAEWRDVRSQLFSADAAQATAGLRHVQCWRCRGRLPLGVDITALLLSIQLRDPVAAVQWQPQGAACSAAANVAARRALGAVQQSTENHEGCAAASTTELASEYALAVIRFVNGISDANQKGKVAGSVAKHAETLGLHPMLVDIRHEATHNHMPSIHALRLAASHTLAWLADKYWGAQARYVHNSCKSAAAHIAALWRNQQARAAIARAATLPAHLQSDSSSESDSDDDSAQRSAGPQNAATAGAAAAVGSASGVPMTAAGLKRAQRTLVGAVRHMTPESGAAGLAQICVDFAQDVLPSEAVAGTASSAVAAQSSSEVSNCADVETVALLHRACPHFLSHLLIATSQAHAATKRMVLCELARRGGAHRAGPARSNAQECAAIARLHKAAAAAVHASAMPLAQSAVLQRHCQHILLEVPSPSACGMTAADTAAALQRYDAGELDMNGQLGQVIAILRDVEQLNAVNQVCSLLLRKPAVRM